MQKKNAAESKQFFALQSKRFLTIITILIIIITLDVSLVRTYDIISKQFISIQGKQLVFLIISVICLVLQYIILELIKPKDISKSKDRINIHRIYKITKYTQYGLGGLVILIVLQIQILSYYNTFALLVAILGSYTLCIGILIKFMIQIIKWISFKKNTILSILFVIALAGILSNALIAIVDTTLRLSYRPEEARPILGGSVDVSKGKFNSLDTAYYISFIFSFISAWISSSVLLSFYSKTIGKLRYLLITLSPLLLFLGQFMVFIIEILSTIIYIDPFFIAQLVTIILTLSKPIGGLMLGIVFWSMSKLIEGINQSIKNYLIVSGLGLFLLFTSNQAILMSITPYPPFGLSTIIIFGFSAYLIMVGIYTSTITISNSVQLRSVIRRLASSKLLDSLAYSEMQNEIEKKLVHLTRKLSSETENQAGISSNITDADVKKYIKEVLDEMGKK